MELMCFANKRKLEDLKVTVYDLKERVKIIDNRLDDVEGIIKQN